MFTNEVKSSEYKQCVLALAQLGDRIIPPTESTQLPPGETFTTITNAQ